MSEAPQVDRKWFLSQLHDQGKSVRGLARHLNLDASAVSRMFSGGRRMRTEEAAEIARFLGAPLREVLAHAGVAIDLDGQPTRFILAAIIDEGGVVRRLTEPRPLPQAVIDRAHAAMRAGNRQVIAAQVRADTGPLAAWDDAVILFCPATSVDHDAIGALSVCRLMSGEQVLARIERARKTGEARLRSVNASAREVVLDTATPVLAVLP